MTTPYEDKVCLWHWKGDSVSQTSINSLADNVKARCPVADAIFVKTSDGDRWQGNFDTREGMRIMGPADVARWVDRLTNKGLDFHAWCVLKGLNVDGEIARIVEVCQVPGVKSMILDVEPYEQYWRGTRNDVIRLMTGVRNILGPNFHIGISVDPRRHWFNAIFPDAWRPYVNSVHPQCYWGTMGRSPESILNETYDTWGNYGLPIYPVLQAHAVAPSSIKNAQDISRSVRGATGVSYWRLGVIGTDEFNAINQEKVESEIGPDRVWRRYGWEKIIAPYQAGYRDGTHTGQPPSAVFTEFTSVRGHPIKYKRTRADRDTVWAIWRPGIPEKGTYELSVFIPGQRATTREARYHIHGVSGLGAEVRVPLNQMNYSDRWVPLVVFEFDRRPEGAQVNLTDLTGESDRDIAFSAVRWRRVLEEVKPDQQMGFDSPVGTLQERMSAQIWPGTWFDATGYATYYTAVGPAYHTGVDLNNNSPHWDADRLAPVYAPADGVVTFSGNGTGTWGHLIIIRHDPLPNGTVVWSRLAHLANPTARQGDRLLRGQQIANIGNSNGRLPYHLHYDIVKTNILESQPSHWPGLNLNLVYQHYHDPRQFTLNNRPFATR